MFYLNKKIIFYLVTKYLFRDNNSTNQGSILIKSKATIFD